MRRYLLPRRLASVFGMCLLALAAIHAFGVCPLEVIGSRIPLFCPFEAITRVPCPGCGMTRALFSVAQGDFGGAIRYNPFSLFLLFVVALSLLPERWLENIHPRSTAVMGGLYVFVLSALLLYLVLFRVIPHIT